MHRTLTTPEILREIFERTLDPEPAYVSAVGRIITTRTVHDAALVCRRWVDPALDVLWSGLVVEVLDINLLQILGPFKHGVPFDFYKGMPSPDEWDRFIFYSSRVVNLNLYMDGSYASPMTHSSFAATRPAAMELFPRMQSIHVTFDPNGEFSPAAILPWIGNNLHQFKCCYSCDHKFPSESTWTPFSMFLCKNAPRIKSIHLGPSDGLCLYSWRPVDIAAFLDGRNLEDLNIVIDYLTAELLTSVSKMIHLKTLCIESKFVEIHGGSTLQLDSMTSLVHLALRGCSMHLANHLLLSSAGCHSVTAFDCSTFDEKPGPGDISTFCSSIISAFPSLVELEIGITFDDSEPPPWLTLKEFTSLSGLKVLKDHYIGGTYLPERYIKQLKSLLTQVLNSVQVDVD